MNLNIFFVLFLFFGGLAAAAEKTTVATMEQAIFNKVNEYRKQQNKPILKYDPIISGICRKHAEEMASGACAFSHVNIQERFDGIRASLSKVASGAENLHWNQGFPDPAAKAVEGWIQSPLHHKALIGDYQLTGVGGAKSKDNRFYFNQFYIHLNKSRTK